MRDFLNFKDFYNVLCMYGMDFFCGVLDFFFKDFCVYVIVVVLKLRYVIISNEG